MFRKLMQHWAKLAILCCLPSAMAFVASQDANKPLKIEADTAEFDRNTGLSCYIHNVKIDQGDMHVRGEKVTTKQDQTNALEEIVIYGSKNESAYYESLPEPGKSKLIATAQTIMYYPKKHYVKLLGHARIHQGDNSIAGEHIEYDIKNQKMHAEAHTDANGQKSRTTIVIIPEKKTTP